MDPKTHPWLSINYKLEPQRYLESVLDYCFDGNIKPEVANSFDMSKSTRWFHAPWQHSSPTGREPIHGCTQERAVPPFWLGPKQSATCQTLAIGFYNEPGGYSFGQVWQNPADPNYQGENGKGVLFPEGTVAFKLLFTQATPDDIPYLKDAPVWQTTVQTYPGNPYSAADPDPPRILGDVRLLQIDVAVKDSRFDNPTGWNFGSFTYDNSVKNANPWRRILPIGLQWGNDPQRTLADRECKLQEGWVNEVAKKRIITWQHGKGRPMVGFDNRLAGPADNFVSACSACHMTAQFPSIANLVLKGTSTADPLGEDIGNSERHYYFRNMKCGEVFDENIDFYQPSTPKQTTYPLDYSLQLQGGLNNFSVWRAAAFPPAAQKKIDACCDVPGGKIKPNKMAECAAHGGNPNLTLR
jgi:hypothetical protein